MTIGIDVSRAFKTEKTGTEWYSYELVKALIALDHETKYRLYGSTPLPKNSWNLPDNADYRYLRWPSKQLWTQGRLSWEMMRTPPELLFVPSHAVPLIHPKKTLTTIHDVGFLHWQEAYAHKEWQYLDWSTRYAVRHCPKIITISEFSKKELMRSYGATDEQVVVTHLGYDQARYVPPMDRVIVQQEVAQTGKMQKPYVLVLGRLDRRKNPVAALKTFEELHQKYPDLSLIFVGPKGYCGEQIMGMIKSSPAAKAITMLGWVSEEEKVRLLQGAEMLLFPSLYEGFGLPVIEAQACGVPVACSNAAALPEIAGDGAILFDPENIAEIVQAVEKILADESLRQDLIVKGLQNAQRFSWEQCARETSVVLQDMAKGDKTRQTV